MLSLPSFTWTLVGKDLPSQPTGRAAHSELAYVPHIELALRLPWSACTLLGSQLIVVGGFVSEDLM